MLTLHFNKIRTASLILLSMPAIVFFLGWTKLFIGIPCCVLLAVAVWLSSKKCEDKVISVSRKALIIAAAVIVIWAILSGQGGIFTQKQDWEARNVIFRDIIFRSWPVKYSNNVSLVYYIGIWLVPALFGKIGVLAGSRSMALILGRTALLIWVSVLIFFVYILLLFKLNAKNKKSLYIILAIMILFSGMDALGAINNPTWFNVHLEWWSKGIQYTSMSAQLCWVFNQSVPAWLVCALMYNEKDESTFALIGLLALTSSPFPFIGIILYMFAFAARNLMKAVKAKEVLPFFKSIFTLQNVLSVIALVPVYAMYYITNSSFQGSSEGGGVAVNNEQGSDSFMIYLFFYLVEFALLLFVIRSKKRRFENLFILITLILIPFVKIGYSCDFCMRASIPSLFLLMINFMEFIIYEAPVKLNNPTPEETKVNQRKLRRYIPAVIIFLIGCITPGVEYYTSAAEFIRTKGSCVTKYDYVETYDNVPAEKIQNFVCPDYTDTIFYKYIAK